MYVHSSNAFQKMLHFQNMNQKAYTHFGHNTTSNHLIFQTETIRNSLIVNKKKPHFIKCIKQYHRIASTIGHANFLIQLISDCSYWTFEEIFQMLKIAPCGQHSCILIEIVTVEFKHLQKVSYSTIIRTHLSLDLVVLSAIRQTKLFCLSFLFKILLLDLLQVIIMA